MKSRPYLGCDDLLATRSSKLERFMQRHLVAVMVFLSVFALVKVGPRPLFGWAPFDHGTPLLPGGNRPWISALQVGVPLTSSGTIPSGFLIAGSFVLAFVYVVLLALITVSRFPKSQILLVWIVIVLGSPGLVLFSGAGSLDGAFLVGAAILTLGASRRGWLIPVAVLLMVYSNPGQSVMAGTALLILTLIPDFRFLRMRASLVLAVGLVAALVEALVTTGSSQARSLPELLSLSLNYSLFTMPLRVLTIYGVFWLLVIVFVFSLPMRYASIATISLIIVPVLGSLVTLDGTRVGVGVASLAFFALVTRAVPVMYLYLQKQNIPSVILVATAAVAPLPLVFMNSVEVPWVFVVHLVNTVLTG